jgi:hypothetical protein
MNELEPKHEGLLNLMISHLTSQEPETGVKCLKDIPWNRIKKDS